MGLTRKHKLAQQSWGATGHAATTVTETIRGKCEQLAVKVSNCTNAITFTVTITNEDGGQLFTKAAIAKGQTTILFANSNKGTPDGDFNAFLAAEPCTISIDPSGDAGSGGVTADVALYLTECGF